MRVWSSTSAGTRRYERGAKGERSMNRKASFVETPNHARDCCVRVGPCRDRPTEESLVVLFLPANLGRRPLARPGGCDTATGVRPRCDSFLSAATRARREGESMNSAERRNAPSSPPAAPARVEWLSEQPAPEHAPGNCQQPAKLCTPSVTADHDNLSATHSAIPRDSTPLT
jgi:hypothetical protein